jgi:hypothetical protein
MIVEHCIDEEMASRFELQRYIGDACERAVVRRSALAAGEERETQGEAVFSEEKNQKTFLHLAPAK